MSLLTLMAGMPKHKNKLTNHISFIQAYSYGCDAEAKNLFNSSLHSPKNKFAFSYGWDAEAQKKLPLTIYHLYKLTLKNKLANS